MHAAGVLVALLALAGAAVCDAAALEALPPYLSYKAFTPHPMGCSASKPLFLR
jgi:hypothetical protein